MNNSSEPPHSRRSSSLQFNAPAATHQLDSTSNQFFCLFNSSEDKGYKVLADRLRSGKHSIKKLAEYVSLRITMESTYASQLTKMANLLISEDIGTTNQTLDALKIESEFMARNHIEFVAFLRSSIDKPLQEIIAQQKTTREFHLSTAEKNIKKHLDAQQAHARLSEKKSGKKSELEAVTESLPKLKTSRDIEKARLKHTKLEAQLKQLDVDLNTASEQLSYATRVWEHDWKKALVDLENIELERMDSIRGYVAKLAMAHHELVAKEMLACDRVRSRADQLDSVYDLQMFLKGLHLPSSESQEASFSSSSAAPSLYLAPQLSVSFHATPSLSASLSQTPLSESTSTHTIVNRAPLTTDDLAAIPSSDLAAIPSSDPANFASPYPTTLAVMGVPPLSDAAVQPYSPVDLLLDARIPARVECTVITRFAYTAQIPEELSFDEGVELPILVRHPDGWWLAESSNDPQQPGVCRRGLIPSNFVQVIRLGGT